MMKPSPALLPAPTRYLATAAEPFVIDAGTRVFAESAHLAQAAVEAIRSVTGGELAPAPTAEEARIVLVLTSDAMDGCPVGAYTLTVDAAGLRVASSTEAGLFAGIQTLRQLALSGAGEGIARIAAAQIDDAPRYAYRGAMLDVARHFFDVDVVLRLIDRLAAFKFNHLHLHLTDDQGWRIEIPERPELTRAGSVTQVGGGAGGFYSIEDYRRIVEHAERNFITVVPEFDAPGHTNAALVSYPELAPAGCEPRPYLETEVGFSTLDIGPESTYAFVDDVIARLAAETPGRYLHIGGDEARSTSAEDFSAFIARATRIVQAHGKTPIVWHEAGRCGDLPTGVVGQYWGYSWAPEDDAVPGRAFVEQGGSIIMSPADLVYLDIKPTADFPLGLTWSAPTISLEQAYSWDPDAVLPGVPASSIIGVEAPLWTETVCDEAGIEAMFFPRLLAVAARAWTTDPVPFTDLERAAGALAPLLERLGIVPGPAGTGFASIPRG